MSCVTTVAALQAASPTPACLPTRAVQAARIAMPAALASPSHCSPLVVAGAPAAAAPNCSRKIPSDLQPFLLPSLPAWDPICGLILNATANFAPAGWRARRRRRPGGRGMGWRDGCRHFSMRRFVQPVSNSLDASHRRHRTIKGSRLSRSLALSGRRDPKASQFIRRLCWCPFRLECKRPPCTL